MVNVDAGGTIADADTTPFIFIVTETGTVQDVNVRLAIKHTWISDLEIILRSPDAKEVMLFDNFGGSGDNLQDTLLADDNTAPLVPFIGPSTPPYAGEYRPGFDATWGKLSEFNGISMTGTWTLSITDSSAGDEGHLYAPGDTPDPAPWTDMIGTQLILEIPEPMAVGVLALGGMAILVRRRRRLA